MSPGRIYPKGITRRRWTVLMAAAPLAAQVTSPTPPLSSPPASTTPATPEARLEKANADIRETSETLRKIEVPIAVEPAFSFKA